MTTTRKPQKPRIGDRVRLVLKNGHQYEGVLVKSTRSETRIEQPLCIVPTWSIETATVIA